MVCTGKCQHPPLNIEAPSCKEVVMNRDVIVGTVAGFVLCFGLTKLIGFMFYR